MSIIPNNIDPSKDYVTQGINPPLTLNGLVYNQIYAHTGVIDSLGNTTTGQYADPTLSIINNSNGLTSFEQTQTTSWFSNPDFGGTSAPVVLTYDLTNTTYLNNITLNILNVPCYVELGTILTFSNTSEFEAFPGTSTFVVNGGTDINTTTDWYRLEYDAPSTITASGNIAIRITRQYPLTTYGQNGVTANVQYSVGIQNLRMKLNVQQSSDVPANIITAVASGTVSGTNYITSQNKFGLVENYSVFTDPQSNMFVTGSGFWKSAPQPVGDSVVYFYAQVSNSGSESTPVTINRLYIDPMYTNCSFNVYYTTSSTSGGAIDPGNFTWSPIPRDFILRKGIYEIPDTSCTYLKFEFTKLVAEAYDLPFDTVDRTINIFPYGVEQYYTQLEQNIINGNAVSYSAVNGNSIAPASSNQVAPSTVFGNATSTVGNNSQWPSLSSLNSSQLGNNVTQGIGTSSQITDPTISYKLLDYNGDYNNQSYTQFLQRRFLEDSVHQYNQVTIPQNWHESYFVGINYMTSFYETTFDDMRSTPYSFYAANGTTTGFPSQDANHIGLMPDVAAYTQWFSTIDAFESFNVAGLTTDWRSFLTQGASISEDPTLMNNLGSVLGQMTLTSGTTLNQVSNLGPDSLVYSVAGSGNGYGIRSAPYAALGGNFATYNDANFISTSGRTTAGWYNVSGATTITGTSLTWSGLVNNVVTSGTASGLLISGTNPTVGYNFTIPNVYSTSGTVAWSTSLGSPAYGVVGYASYSPVTSGVTYYFSVNTQTNVSGTQVSFSTQFINPTTSGAISGTLVSGTTLALPTGIAIQTLSGTNYSTSIPSNTIQLLVSGTNPYSIYQFEMSSSPITSWVSPVDRSNMRISGVARLYLPNSNNGTYRVSLFGVNQNNNNVEIAYKVYTANTMPVKTWFDVELESYTSSNMSNFWVQVQQQNPNVSEVFYVSMLAPFYHPIRWEYTTTAPASGTTISNGPWLPITAGINHPDYSISVSGNTASGIQLRLTGLDPYVYVTGTSIVPNYKQSPFYANLSINYLGSSKTNEVESRTSVENKPYFQLNQEVHPAVFDIVRIAGTILPFSLD